MSATMNEVMKSSTRSIRKVEAPRPLKKSSEPKVNTSCSPLTLSSFSIESVDKLVILMDMVVEAILQSEDTLNDVSGDDAAVLTNNIAHLCKHLRIFGPQLENTIYQGQLDRACSVFRDAIAHGSLDYQARAQILDTLELRLNSWKPQRVNERNIFSSSNSESESFHGLSDLKNYVKNFSVSDSSNTKPDDLLSRLNRKTSKSQIKNQFKDEIIIRNADSGKVMGIKGRRVHMIEQLSDTIISFQRVAPTAKERLVQITGANEENVIHATRLIGDTIKRNTSPVNGMFSRSNSSSSSIESFPEQLGCDEFDGHENKARDKSKSSSVAKEDLFTYKHKVFLSNCQLTISGEDYTYVTVAKAVLDDYFSKIRDPDFVKDKDENVICDNVSPRGKFDDRKIGERSQSVSSSFQGAPSSPRKASKVAESYEPFSVKSSPSEYSFSRKIFAPSDAKTSDSDLTDEVIEKSVDQTSLDHSIDDTENTNAESGDTIEPVDDAAVTYTKEFLLNCRASKLSQEKPKDWDLIASKFSALVKISDDSTDFFGADKSDE